jgi:hypothetical protein
VEASGDRRSDASDGEPMMLLWPTAAVFGFLALTGLVIAMGTSTTARYEFGRNRVSDREAVAVGAPVGGGGGLPSDRGAVDPGRPDRQDDVVESAARPATAVGVATHPAGKRTAAHAPEAGWWLVDASDDDEGDGLRVVAGPFPARLDAEWAAVSGALIAVAPMRTVHGVRAPGGPLVRRPSPHEQSWLAELGEELDGLADDWDPLLTDADSLATLVTEVTAALVDAGLGLHDCDERRTGEPAAGGVCLTPAPDSGGILVVWRQHDRMSADLARGPAADAGVQRVMNSAVAGVLEQLGFAVEPVSGTGCHLVTALRP